MLQHYEPQLTQHDIAKIDALAQLSARHERENEAGWGQNLIGSRILIYASDPRWLIDDYARMKEGRLFGSTLVYRVTEGIVSLCAPHFGIIHRLPRQPETATMNILGDDPDYANARTAWMHAPYDRNLYGVMRAHELIALIDVRARVIANTDMATKAA